MKHLKLFIFIFIFVFSAHYMQATWDKNNISISSIILSIVCIFYSMVMSGKLMDTTKLYVLPVLLIIAYYLANWILMIDHLIK
ncbi:hypothetical protein GW626_19285 [Peribacillus muralis]|uniref:hypothetical protein n=1 Tax=Peribacillus muralis TaxID=264697 RepID=UPI001F4EBFBF|nr:hypothetical protein [Peribacillus muralis]MCK1994753.1 hypothetical protein [Peribacillus muralis]MCK2015420.1 hypothetical protein [Peribacillus muralis]